MSQSGKVGQLYPAGQTGTNTSTHLVVEQRPFWVPNGVLLSFFRFQRWIADSSNLPLVASSEQSHWTNVAALAGVTMGN